MGEVNGTFIYNGSPRNGATAKLWQEAQFGSPPEYDDAEPGAGQQGSTITTDPQYGGDGAYRWTSVPNGSYYASLYYDSHRVWQYYHVEEDIETTLTTEGDLLVRGASAIARLGVGSEDDVLAIQSGVPAWAAIEPDPTEEDIDEDIAVTEGSYGTISTATIGATIDDVLLVGATTRHGTDTLEIQGLYNSVQKFYANVGTNTQVFRSWLGAGLGSAYTAEIQAKKVGGSNTYWAGGGIYSIDLAIT